MVITSKSNKTVAFVASLKNKKARRENSAYVVEGKKMVAEAFAAGKRVKLVMVAESVENEMSFPIEHITVSDAVFRYVSDEVTPQGVLAVLSIEKKTITKADGVSVLLDGISDPGNLYYFQNRCGSRSKKNISRKLLRSIFSQNGKIVDERYISR